MHNVKRFLEESMYAFSLILPLPFCSLTPLFFPTSFEPSAAARARATSEGNPRPEDLIPVYRKRTNIDTSGRETTISQTYYIIDNAEVLGKFGADAWDRVVCVMTTGQGWQFRPYKWKEPLALFHHGWLFYFIFMEGIWTLLMVLECVCSQGDLCFMVERSTEPEN